MTIRVRAMTLFSLVLLAVIPACGGDTDAIRAIDASVVRVELSYLWAGAPIEKRCTPRYARTRLTFDRGTKAATWNVCEGGVMVDRSGTLSDDEAARVERSLARITYEDEFDCDGYDGMLFQMTTAQSDGGSQHYVHANINCAFGGSRRAPAVQDAYQTLLALLPPS